MNSNDQDSDALAEIRAENEQRDRNRKALLRLQARLEFLRGSPPSEAVETAEQLAELERSYLELAQQIVDQQNGKNAQQGFPLLDDLDDWHDLAENLGLENSAQAAEKTTCELFESEMERYHESLQNNLPPGEIEPVFQALLEVTTQELEALSRHPENPPGRELLGTIRSELRERLVELFHSKLHDEEARQHWVTLLLDQADVVLTGIDDLPPLQAAAQLRVVYDDLKWYVSNIETARSRRRRSLRSKINRIHSEWQERVLQGRLEAKYGTGWVSRWERMILVMIILVLGVLFVQFSFAHLLSHSTIVALEIFDGIICGFFLVDFFGKLSYSPDRGLWFRRNWLFGLLPSIPFGLIFLLAPGVTMGSGGDPLRLGRLARFFQLTRLGRYVVILRPAVRIIRALGFLIRGIDRLARRLGPVLNRNIILFPTREERKQARQAREAVTLHLRRFHTDLVRQWEHVLTTSSQENRPQIVHARVNVLYQAHNDRLMDRPLYGVAQREISAEEMLRWLATISAQDVEADLGEELSHRIARIVRLFARPPVSWMPIVSACVPRLSRHTTDAAIVAAFTRRTASLLKKYHDRWFWVADLYGTVTPSQFIDRVGQMLVKSSSRPAYRLLMFGGAYLLVQGLLYVFTPPEFINAAIQKLENLVGTTVAVLGGICLVVLGIGFWLKRLAQEATEFYERSAQAQFLALTETIRCRALPRDASIIYDRVLAPEDQLSGSLSDGQPREELRHQFIERVQQTLVGGHFVSHSDKPFDPVERTSLLYRDGLDGAMLAGNDTRTTSQLIANPSLRQFQSWSERISDKQLKQLDKLDLERQKSILPGPYLWFNFISRAVAHSAARLIIEYNRHAIPLAELPYSTDLERQRYQAWLNGEEFDDSVVTEAAESESGEPEGSSQEGAKHYVTTNFTALHFLDTNKERDQEIADRFGPELLQRMKRDRSLMIRRIFGTFPLHNRPKEQRVLNLYTFYEDWLAGGRALLMPVFLLGVAWSSFLSMLAWGWQSIREIQDPRLRVDPVDAAQADFSTACRKINRMRGSVTYASIRLRTMLDPEYLGLHIPGVRENTLQGADIDVDAEFLDSDPWILEQINYERQRAEADMERLSQMIKGGLLERLAEQAGFAPNAFRTPEHLRAAACAYLGDLQGVRRYLSAPEIIKETFAHAAQERPLPMKPWIFWRQSWLFPKAWQEFGNGDPDAKLAAWRAVTHDFWGVDDALTIWSKQGDEARAEGERRLMNLLRRPSRISEQLVTLRTIQTLALLDVLNYRAHLYQLGDYASMGDEPDQILNWGEHQEQALFERPKPHLFQTSPAASQTSGA